MKRGLALWETDNVFNLEKTLARVIAGEVPIPDIISVPVIQANDAYVIYNDFYYKDKIVDSYPANRLSLEGIMTLDKFLQLVDPLDADLLFLALEVNEKHFGSILDTLEKKVYVASYKYDYARDIKRYATNVKTGIVFETILLAKDIAYIVKNYNSDFAILFWEEHSTFPMGVLGPQYKEFLNDDGVEVGAYIKRERVIRDMDCDFEKRLDFVLFEGLDLYLKSLEG